MELFFADPGPCQDLPLNKAIALRLKKEMVATFLEVMNWLHHVLSGLAIIVSLNGLRSTLIDYLKSERPEQSLGLILVFVAILGGAAWSAIITYVVKLPIYMTLSMDVLLIVLNIGLYYILFFEESDD